MPHSCIIANTPEVNLMRLHVKHLVLVGAWAVLAAPSYAQYRPVVSPYLNLARTGDPAVNYYGLVRPQIAFNRAIQNINNDINYIESNPNLPVQTGHAAGFMTQGRYFMTTNRGYGYGGY